MVDLSADRAPTEFKWRRIRFNSGDELVLTETPSQVYDRVAIDGPRWVVEGPREVLLAEPGNDGYVFEVFGARYLDQHQIMVDRLASSHTRRDRLELAPIVVLCAEVLDGPTSELFPVLPGQVVWILMDDLAEQDKVNLWDSILEANT